MPLSWLYIRTQLTSKPLSKWDLLHLLPVLIYFIDYWPFFFSSVAFKEAVINADLHNMEELLRFKQGWLLPKNTQIPLRATQTAFYWLLQIRLLASTQAASIRKDLLWRRWMILFNSLQILMFLPTLIVLILALQAYFWASTIPPVAGALLSAMALFFYPHILYSIKKPKNQPLVRTKPIRDDPAIQRVASRLEKVMKEQQAFLDPNYSLQQLADAIEVPLYKLSAYFNQIKGINFSDYLNNCRINYCLDQIRDKKLINLNLHGIATKCGFNNRNTFSNAFRKVTGKSPSSYLNSTD